MLNLRVNWKNLQWSKIIEFTKSENKAAGLKSENFKCTPVL